MASILDLLKTQTGDELVQKASETTSEDKDKVVSALGMALPVILGVLKQKSQKEKEAEEISKALNDEKHKGDLLDRINQTEPEELTGEGNKILGHILGDKQNSIVQTISTTLNLNEGSVKQILQMAAPVIMSLLGSQKRKDKVGTSGIQGLIDTVLGSGSAHENSLIESLMSGKGDAKIVKDITGTLLGGKKGKKGGSILGGFTGGK